MKSSNLVLFYLMIYVPIRIIYNAKLYTSINFLEAAVSSNFITKIAFSAKSLILAKIVNIQLRRARSSERLTNAHFVDVSPLGGGAAPQHAERRVEPRAVPRCGGALWRDARAPQLAQVQREERLKQLPHLSPTDVSVNFVTGEKTAITTDWLRGGMPWPC